jgi:hypothetical protein
MLLFLNYTKDIKLKYSKFPWVSRQIVTTMKNKNASWLATAAIILLLVLAGPAKAFTLSLNIDNPNPTRGELITFTASIDIQKGEHLPIEFLTLTLSGAETQVCKFSPSGQILETCKGIVKIEKTQEQGLGYGYGYGYGYSYGYGYNFGYGYGYGYSGAGQSGKLTYKITLNTADYTLGVYQTELAAKMKSHPNLFTQAGPQLTINQEKDLYGSRGDDDEQCETSWTCTEWSACVNGHQYRSCTLVDSDCSIYPETPLLARSCSIQQINLQREDPSETPEDEIPTLSEDDSSGISRITGAVIGPFGATLADLFLVIAGFLIVIGGLSVILIIRKIHLKNQPAFYTGKFR